MKRQTTFFGDTVASHISALLARCDRLKLAGDLKPTMFDAAGEEHAAAVAAADTEGAWLADSF